MTSPRNPALPGEPAPLLVDAKAAARMCGIGTSTFWRWDAAGRIPQPVRMGGTTRWRVAELQAWTEAGCPDRLAWQALQQQHLRKTAAGPGKAGC